MLRASIYIVLTYIIMQFSSILGVPLFYQLFDNGMRSSNDLITLSSAYWSVISFGSALVIILLILRRYQDDMQMRGPKLKVSASIGWIVAGPFIALFAQGIAGIIEERIGIPIGSENTASLIEIAKTAPIFILVISIFAPVLEEIVFRKVLFGSLYKKFNFFLAALISSVIFALVHGEPEHTLIYASMGFTFAFLYVKTKRLIVPILAHVFMNTYVVVVNFFLADKIKELQEQAVGLWSFFQ